MDIKLAIGILAGAITAVATVPQIFKLIKDKNSKDVSPFMFFVLLAGNGLWCYYGILLSDIPIIVTNAFSAFCDLILIFLNYKYAKKKG